MTPVQARMARAALQLSLRDLAAELQVSAMALSKYETSGEGIGASTAEALETFFRSKGVFCGPRHSISVGQDTLAQERFLVLALNQLLHEAGIHPTTRDLIAAYERARRAMQAWPAYLDEVAAPGSPLEPPEEGPDDATA